MGCLQPARTELNSFAPCLSFLTDLSRSTDDDILKFLGNQDGLTEEQRVQFIDGLKDALGAIRKKNIRDFDAIAQEILAYRRRFLGDDSKVLALEGTTI